MKHRILFILSIILLATTWAMAQAPTMTYDGTKLRVMVPEGYLELKRDAIGNDAISNCFTWTEDGSCLFMAQPDPYVFEPQGLQKDAQLGIEGLFNGEPVNIAVEMVEPSSGGKGAATDPEPGSDKMIDRRLAAGAACRFLGFEEKEEKSPRHLERDQRPQHHLRHYRRICEV